MTPVLSHDGSAIIIPAIGTDGVRRLWLRRLDSATIELLPGTDNAFLPFWFLTIGRSPSLPTASSNVSK